MTGRRRTAALCLCIGACVGACREKRAAEPAPALTAPATPDRLSESERLPEAEVAFGLPLPAGMRLVRQFDDAAYFAGDLELDAVLEHVRKHVRARDVEAQGRGVLFARANVIGDDTKRLLRIELDPTDRGTRLHIRDITPPPALTGANAAEIWRQAGRRPDGTPLDQDQAY